MTVQNTVSDDAHSHAGAAYVPQNVSEVKHDAASRRNVEYGIKPSEDLSCSNR